VTRAATAALRIGCVKYLNAQPLIHGWPGPVVFEHPTVICQMLAGGDLDVALVSSFEFLRNPIYSIVDGVAVAADGPVYSVFVAHAGTLDELEEITLDPASQTSANLLRCLLADRQSAAQLVTERGEEISPQRGRLLIGDQAIRFRQQHESDYNFWDLGAEWKRTTSLPFVFAIWLIRPEVAGGEAMADLLRARRDANLASLDEVVRAQRDFPAEFSLPYFRDFLRFDFANAEKQGLLMFRTKCEKHGILPPNRAPLRLI